MSSPDSSSGSAYSLYGVKDRHAILTSLGVVPLPFLWRLATCEVVNRNKNEGRFADTADLGTGVAPGEDQIPF